MGKKQPGPELNQALAALTGMGATDLTARALTGDLARAYGRDEVVERVLADLAERRSVLLLGPAGVGKTAIIHEVVNRVAEGQAPAALHGACFVQMSTATIERGAHNVGMWSANLGTVVDALKAGKRIFLYIDNIWDLRNAGRYSGATESFATFLRPLLETKTITIIGESTRELYARWSSAGFEQSFSLADDPSLVACFSLITLEEPDAPTVKTILSSFALGLEGKFGVNIDAPALERTLELTQRFLPYEALPGKAVRLLREVASGMCLDQKPSPSQPEVVGRPGRGATAITGDDIIDGLARLTGLPRMILSDRMPLRQTEIRAAFEERVVGQTRAVSTVVDLVTLIKAELNDPNRPLGVLLFVGPTGTGKTLLAKTLAEYLFGSERKLIRFDMSEYDHQGSLPQLSRLLVERVRQESFSVVLLDEIEKAAYPVFDLFLQAFDDARLTDSSGRTVDLRNTIFIMTSNLHANVQPARRIGFGLGEPETSTAPDEDQPWLEAVHGYFRPEFINRLDHIVVFHSLDVDNMRRIARRELALALVRAGVTRRNILLDFHDDVIEILLREGFSEVYGARPLQRAIKRLALLPVARRIAAHPDEGEQLLELRARGGKIQIEQIPLRPASPTGGQPGMVDVEGHEQAEPESQTRQPSLRLDELAVVIAGLRDRLAAICTSERFHALEEQARRLLAASTEPDIWQDEARARGIYNSIYHLERVTDALRKALLRAEALAEVPVFITRHRDKTGAARLEEKYRQLEREVALAEIEFLALDPGGTVTDAAFVSVSAVSAPGASDPADWPATVADMYKTWAQRRGYEVESIAEPKAREIILAIRGPSVDCMLAKEEGIHKRQIPDDEPGRSGRPRSRVQLARVEVLCATLPSGQDWPLPRAEVQLTVLAEDYPGQSTGRLRRLVEAVHSPTGTRVCLHSADATTYALGLLAARLDRAQRVEATSSGEVVRLYNYTGAQYVRDPRSGVRDPRPREVLAGEIDRFLLANLKP